MLLLRIAFPGIDKAWAPAVYNMRNICIKPGETSRGHLENVTHWKMSFGLVLALAPSSLAVCS